MKKAINIFVKIVILFIVLHIILLTTNLFMKYKNQNEDYTSIDEYDCERILVKNGQKLMTREGVLSYDLTWRYFGEEMLPKTKNRILIIGDSFVWGYHNNNANTIYWKYLQRIFEENGYNDVEIVAAGIPGLGTYEELEYILENKEYIDKINPDLVIMGFLSNDWEPLSKNDELYIKKFDFDKFVREQYESGIYKIFKKLYPYLYDWFVNYKVKNMTDKEDYNQKYGAKYGYNYGDVIKLKDILDLDKYIDKYENDAVKRLANLNYPFLVFHELFPIKGEFDEYFEEQAISIFKKHGIEVINPVINYDLLIETTDIRKIYNNSKDCLHPSELLNKFYAKEIYYYLTNNYSEIVGEKSKVKKFDIEINDYYPYLEIDFKKIDNYEYKFIWPEDEEMFYYWTNTHTVKLNLKYPMKLSELKLSGKFTNARIWINPENGQDEYIELQNEDNVFKILDEMNVASINIHVDADVGTEIELMIEK